MSDGEKTGFIAKMTGPKKRWRAYKSRVKELPENYRTVVEAIERYRMHFVHSNASTFEDLADLFEQAAVDGTPIREIVGEDPAEFAEAFAQNYTEGGYVPARARKQLTDDIERAAGAQTGPERQDGLIAPQHNALPRGRALHSSPLCTARPAGSCPAGRLSPHARGTVATDHCVQGDS
ncbi:DUF1048 domain-containing protein [Streptomyces sp. NBC_01214]|uniref:DUF1048 domain-containing protein n=1 Tax=Streptomyces sp. NBC_01214 TaxID=2903777 RepID=UPI00224E0094|nr:DUF1048 domain-containing protein [Streptomyces sp. NBC_01214]MCX4807507.1 DUF1048 domain-containing protein [Streptomyces sp. NBC_01214]